MNKKGIMKIFLMIFTFSNTNSFAKTEPDCSKYSTKTYLGLLDKIRCKKGLPVEERIKPKKFSDLNPFKSRDESGKIIQKKVISCKGAGFNGMDRSVGSDTLFSKSTMTVSMYP